MSQESFPTLRAPIPAVGVACLRGDAVLLIRRAAPPFKGAWSIPGGRIAWGESARAAAARELMEETGISAEIGGLIDVVDGVFEEPGMQTRHYLLISFAARWQAGELRAGDDALEARFTPLSDLDGLGMWSQTTRIIRLAEAMTW